MALTYSVSQRIDAPRSYVAALLIDPDHYTHWMPGLQRAELTSGTHAQPGATTRFVFDQKGRSMSMTETVEANDLPERYVVTYEDDAGRVWNRVENVLEDTGDGATLCTAHCEFQFKTFFMRILGRMMPGAFKKQSRTYLSDFKALAENTRPES